MNVSVSPITLAQSRPPVLSRKPERLCVIVGNKLVGLDSILPVAMELKAENPGLAISFLFLSAKALAVVERNYVLHAGLKRTGAIHALSSGKRRLTGKLGAAFRLLQWCARLLGKRSLLLSHADFGRFPLNLLAYCARRGAGAVCTYCKPAFPGNPALSFAHGLKTKGRDMRWKDSGEAFLIYHPTQANDYAGYTGAPCLLVGTSRDFPAWRRFLTQIRDENGIRDEQGRDLTALPKPVIALFYPGPAVIPHQTDDVRETFHALLKCLREQAPAASIVVKPHPICDLDLLRRDLQDFPSLDVRISHAHPQLLLQLATAAISTNGSYVQFDCYLEGVPVIETTRYRADILAIDETLFPNRGRIDASDRKKWPEIFQRVVSAPERLPKPERSEIAWPKPADLSACLWPQD